MIEIFSKFYKRPSDSEKLCSLMDQVSSLKDRLSETQQRLQRSLKIRHELAEERQMRKRLVDFLQENTVITKNPDGTYTHTITSFVPDFKLLFITRKELGIKDTP